MLSSQPSTDLRRAGTRLGERLFVGICLLAIALPIGLLLFWLGALARAGLERFEWGFLLGYPSRRAGLAGILPGLVGSLWLISLTALLAVPVGVAAAVYLEEYQRRGRLADWIELNIAHLAGVPSVVYGLLGLAVFVRQLGLGRSVLAGAATLALLVLPIVILSAREALRSVPPALREACHALGATRWQTVRRVVLPPALPGIVTGSMLALSRAIGETAPLILVGALSYVTFLPYGIDAPYSALPIQVFSWLSRPQQEFLANAAAGSVVLLGCMLLLQGLAGLLRRRWQLRGS